VCVCVCVCGYPLRFSIIKALTLRQYTVSTRVANENDMDVKWAFTEYK